MMKVLLVAAFALVVCCPVTCAMPFVAALTALADKYAELCADKSAEAGIAHADSSADADFLENELRSRGFTGECLKVMYEPVTGSHVGPGTVALFFNGIHK